MAGHALCSVTSFGYDLKCGSTHNVNAAYRAEARDDVACIKVKPYHEN